MRNQIMMYTAEIIQNKGSKKVFSVTMMIADDRETIVYRPIYRKNSNYR
jgi:hypothetical protein